MVLSFSPAALEAIQKLRDSPDLDYVMLGFPSQTLQALDVVGTGGNGVEGIKSCTAEEGVYYGLLKVTINYETTGAIKTDVSRFLFIYIVPPGLPMKQKMKLGPNLAGIKKHLKPFVYQLDLETAEELSAEKVSDIVHKVTGKNKNVLDVVSTDKRMIINGRKVANRSNTTDKEDVFNKNLSNISSSFVKAKGAEVSMDNVPDFQLALADFRSDKSDINWLIASYLDKKTVSFMQAGSSTEPVKSLLEAASTEQISYGLFRLTEKFDQGVNQVRFGFVTVIPKDMSVISKATASTHKATVTPWFRPFHASFTVESIDELSDEKAYAVFASTSGSKSKVTEKKQQKQEVKYERKMIGGATTDTQALGFKSEDSEERIQEGLKQVRSGEAKFVSASFIGTQLEFTNVGSSLSELTDEGIQYLMVRYSETVDGYETVKFAQVCLQGDVSPKQRAEAGTKHGAVTKLLGQAHVTVFMNTVEEVVAKFN